MTMPNIRELLPQSGPMVMLDELVHAEVGALTARFTPRAENLFTHAGEMGAWVGIECMAQAMAALIGWEAKQRNEPVRVGLLLGTRRYVCHVPCFTLDEPLLISARTEYIADNGIGVMDCQIRTQDGRELASASLTAYQPDDFQAFLENPI